jgi:ubiquinone/menaquinone biosynthesis C-methylase UbiE
MTDEHTEKFCGNSGWLMPGMERYLIHGWDNLKAQDDIDHYVSYLDAVSSSGAGQRYKRQTFELLHIREGHYILDVGCGLGEDALALSPMVGDGGLVVGVDLNEPLILEAQRRLGGSRMHVSYCMGDANRLGFADDSFNGCRIDRVLLHCKNPGGVIAEMARVCGHGSWIVASEADWGTLVIDSPDKQLTQTILNFRCDLFPTGWIGRQLPRLFNETGLTEIQVFPDTGFIKDFMLADKLLRLGEAVEYAREADVVSAHEASQWLVGLENLSRQGRFFCSVTLFIVAGKKF